MKSLTDKQKKILDFIREEVVNRNYPPSVREICQKMNVGSSSTVHSHLRALERKGYLKRDPAKPRALELLEPSQKIEQKKKPRLVPLVSQVAANKPILSEENIESYIVLPENYAEGEKVYVIRVKGDEMNGVGILQNDLIIIRQQSTAENGEMILALIDKGEVIIKKYFQETGQFQILGKVIGLLRSFE